MNAEAWSDRDIIERVRPIKELHRRLTAIATEGVVANLDEELQRAEELGLRPIDVLVGVLQPALNEIGALWQRGEIVPAQEAKLTEFCENAIGALRERQRKRLERDADAPVVLLLAVHGNAHTLGMKMLAFALREQGMDPRILMHTPTPTSLRELCALVSPRAIGISVALPEQAPASLVLVSELLTLGAAAPLLVVGGRGISESMVLPAGVTRWRRTDSLLSAAALFAR